MVTRIRDNWVLAKETAALGMMGYLKRLDPGDVKVMCVTKERAQRFSHEQAVNLARQLNLVPVRLRQGRVIR